MYLPLEAYPVTVSGAVQVSKVLPIVIMHMTTFVAADYFKQRTVFLFYVLRD